MSSPSWEAFKPCGGGRGSGFWKGSCSEKFSPTVPLRGLVGRVDACASASALAQVFPASGQRLPPQTSRKQPGIAAAAARRSSAWPPEGARGLGLSLRSRQGKALPGVLYAPRGPQGSALRTWGHPAFTPRGHGRDRQAPIAGGLQVSGRKAIWGASCWCHPGSATSFSRVDRRGILPCLSFLLCKVPGKPPAALGDNFQELGCEWRGPGRLETGKEPGPGVPFQPGAFIRSSVNISLALALCAPGAVTAWAGWSHGGLWAQGG